MRPEPPDRASLDGEKDGGFQDGGVAILETLAVLAGYAALALAPGISIGFVVAASVLLVVWTAARGTFGWAVPDGAARLVNLLFLVYVAVSIAITGSRLGPTDQLATARTLAHDLILFLVIHTLQRRTFRSAALRLLAAAGCFAVASWLTSSTLLAPLVLVGLVNGAGASMLLVLARARNDADDQRRLGRTEHVRVSRRPLVAAFSGLFVALRLSVFLLLGTLAIYVLIPRRIEVDSDGDGTAGDGLSNAATGVDGSGRRTGITRGLLTLNSIGRIKRDTRAAYDVSTRMGTEPVVLRHEDAYFRVGVYGSFDGRSWRRNESRSVHHDSGLVHRLERPRSGGRLVTQSFLIRLPPAAGIPSLYRPFMVRRGSEMKDGPVYFRAGATLAFAELPVVGDLFSVTSSLGDPRGRDLAFVPLTDRERQLYGSWAGTTPRLERIAHAVAGDARGTDALDKFVAWFRDDFTYTLNVPKLGAVPLETFLDPRGRRGHCELFASSLAMLGRLMGVPTRLVVGFRPVRTRSATFSLYNSDAHAWVEAWTEDRGWVRYDPTPPAAERLTEGSELDGSSGDAKGTGLIERLVAFDRETQHRWYAGATDWVGSIDRRHLFGAGIVVLAASALGVGLLRRGGLRRARGRSGARDAPPIVTDGGSQVRRSYLRMLDVLSRRGLRRKLGETAREFAGRVAHEARPEAGDVRALTALFESVRYAGRAAGQDVRKRAAGLVRAIERARAVKVPPPA